MLHWLCYRCLYLNSISQTILSCVVIVLSRHPCLRILTIIFSCSTHDNSCSKDNAFCTMCFQNLPSRVLGTYKHPLTLYWPKHLVLEWHTWIESKLAQSRALLHERELLPSVGVSSSQYPRPTTYLPADSSCLQNSCVPQLLLNLVQMELRGALEIVGTNAADEVRSASQHLGH